MESEEPQRITAPAFLPSDEYYSQEKSLLTDFRNGIFAKAKILESMRLGDKYQGEMVIIDAVHSLAEIA